MNVIADLLARLQVTVDGAQQAQREVRQVSDEMDRLAQAGQRTSDAIQNASDRLQISTQKVSDAANRLRDAEQNISSLGVTVEQAGAAFRKIQDDLSSGAAEINEIARAAGVAEDRLGDLRSFAEAGFVAESIAGQFGLSVEEAQRIKDIVNVLRNGLEGAGGVAGDAARAYEEWIGSVEGLVNAQGRQIADQRRLDREVDRFGRTAQRGRRGVNNLRLSFEQMGQVFRQLASGRFSLSSLGSLLGRVIAAAAPLVAAISPAIAAFGIFRSRIGQLGTQIAATRPEIVGLASDINNIDLSQALTQLETFSNRLASFGFENSDQVARDIFGIAESIEALNSTPGDLPQVAQAVQRAVESADLSGLRDFDLEINTSEVNRQLQETKSRFGEAAAQAEAFGILSQVAFEKTAENGRRATEELSSFQSVTASLRGAWDRAIAGNEEFQASVEALGDTFQSLITQAEPLFDFIGERAADLVGTMNAVFEGIDLIANAILGTLDRVAGGFVGFAREIANVIEEIPVIGEALVGLLPEGVQTGELEAELQTLAEYRSGLFEVNRVLADMRRLADEGADPGTTIANALQNILSDSRVTVGVEGIERLQRAINGSNQDVRDATGFILDHAEALALTDRQVAELTEAYDTFSGRADQVSDSLPEIARTLDDIRKAAADFVQEAQGGAGVVNALADIGEASRALSEDASPANALQFFQAYSEGITEALNGGADKIIAFREFVETQLRPQLSTEEYDALISVIDQTERAFAPLAAEADRLAGANVSAADTARDTTGRFIDLDGAARDATSGVNGLTGALEQMTGTYPVDIVISTTGGIPNITTPIGAIPARTSGGGTTFRGGVGAPTSITSVTGSSTAAAASNFESRAATVSAAATGRSPEVQAAIDAAVAAKDAAAVVEKSALRTESENLADLLGRFDRRGGGGGGGGGTPEPLLDVEGIKAFLQEVNRAIAIASREGVRIGTAGNAIPFEEGSFLNSEGGGLSVDTILIRGVWDFADPATKRQIINELQEALKSLQAEV